MIPRSCKLHGSIAETLTRESGSQLARDVRVLRTFKRSWYYRTNADATPAVDPLRFWALVSNLRNLVSLKFTFQVVAGRCPPTHLGLDSDFHDQEVALSSGTLMNHFRFKNCHEIRQGNFISISNGLHECWRFNGELGRHVRGHSILSYPILQFHPRRLHCPKLTRPHPVNEGQAQHLLAPILEGVPSTLIPIEQSMRLFSGISRRTIYANLLKPCFDSVLYIMFKYEKLVKVGQVNLQGGIMQAIFQRSTWSTWASCH